MTKYLLLFIISLWHIFSYANDECANAVQLTPGTTCTYTTGSFSGMTMTGAAPSCGSNSIQDVWYKFTATDSTMSISLGSVSGLNHGFELIQGSCGGTVIACVNNYASSYAESYFNNNFIPGQVYYIRVFNAISSLSTASFSICVQKYAAPSNDVCANATVLTPGTSCTNTSATFSGAMMNGGTPACGIDAFQDVWYKFTATDSTMSISLGSSSGLNHGFEIIQGSCGGTVVACVNGYGYSYAENYFNNNFIPGQVYYIRVFNAAASLTTLSFTICVQRYPSPANDQCVNATTLTPGTTCTNVAGTFSGAMMNGGIPSCGINAIQDVWYKFTATDATMSINLGATSGLNHGFEIIQGSCNGTVIECVNGNGISYSESYFNNNFIPGQVYYIRVFNASGALTTASFTICVQKFPSPANDACANAITLTPYVTCGYTTVNFSGAMMNGPAPSCAPNASQDVWYKFVATDSTLSIDLDAQSGVNHGFELIQGGCGGTVLFCMNNNGTSYSEGYFNNNFIPGQEYYIRVFNVSGNLSTSSFLMCIRKYPSPSNDLCSNAITITPGTSCGNISATFSGAMMNGPAPSCAPNASQDIWYKFVAVDSTMSIDLTATSGVNHGFEIIQGSCTGTVIACMNNNGVSYSEGYFNNNFIPGQTYYLRIFNASANLSTTSFTFCVRRYPVPPNDLCSNAITITPGTSCGNISATFSGAMMNGPVPSCAPNASQDIWYKFVAVDSTMSVDLTATSGVDFGFEIIQGGCTGTVVACMNNFGTAYSEGYFNNNFIPGQTYYLRIFNASGNLSTTSFTFCVRRYPVPPNDLCSSATTITPGTSCGNISATFSGAMMNGPAPSCAPNASQDIWYKFVAVDSTMSIDLTATSGVNHGFEIIQGGCNGTVITCMNNNGASYSEGYFNNNFIPGQTYYLRIFNASGNLSTASFTFCVRRYPTPVNDQCMNAIELTPNPSCSYTYGTFSGAMMNGGIPACAISTPQDVWYKFTASATSMGIQLNANSGLNSGFQVYEGSCSGSVINCTNANGSSYSEAATLTSLTIGQTYYIRVINASSGLTTSTFGICLTGPTPTSCTPSVSISTSNTTICQGSSTVFTAVPTHGGTSPSYQWKVDGGNVGTNSATYTTSTLLSGSVVTCVMGSNASCASPTVATSNAITMTVVSNVTPTFTQIPSICSGDPLSLPTTSNNGISGTWSPAVNNTATTTYTFTPNGGQCATTTTMTVSVGSVVPTFTQVAAICTGGSFTLPTTSNNGISGTWSPAINNTTTTTYTFTPNGGQCASQTTMTVTVNTGTVPSFNQIAAICTGGSFTLPTTSTNGISGTWSPAVNNTATTTYTFTPNTGQCATTTTMTVTVNTGSTTPSFTQVAAICTGGSFTLPTTSTNGITGSWSPAVNNTATTTYTFTPNAGQCATTTTMTVTVNNASITPTFTQIAAICPGGSLVLPGTSTNGISGSWSPAVNNTATTTYTFTPNGGQCATTTTMTVAVSSTAVTPTFTQIPAICIGGSFTLPTTSNNGISGTWSPAVNNTATTTYTFTPNAGQCGSTTTMTVTVNTTSVTPTFNQVPAICAGGSFTLPTTSTNGISGTWSPAVNNMATTTYTFTPNAGQCGTTTTMTVTVNNSVTPTFTQVPAICSGGSFTLPTTSTNGINGTWSPAVDNTVTTTYTFTPTSGQCVVTTTMTVVVNSVNTGTSVQGNTITALATGATYQWINCLTNQPINGAINASFTPTESGAYAVTVTQNGCSETSDCEVMIVLGLEANTQKGWNVYPNPASDELFVELDETSAIEIMDMTGKVIQTQVLKPGKNAINIHELSTGVYFLRSASGANVKFVKKM